MGASSGLGLSSFYSSSQCSYPLNKKKMGEKTKPESKKKIKGTKWMNT